jgi:hypothetical protein
MKITAQRNRVHWQAVTVSRTGRARAQASDPLGSFMAAASAKNRDEDMDESQSVELIARPAAKVRYMIF